MEASLDFQSIVMTLQRFWAEQGCLIWQPYNVQVGAGTMNPATYLRVLGPEPWHVAYVETSIRPDDARYGENPNRMQMHHQFQVILKPDPGNPQEVYLRSLEALGINPRQHDVRFVEDNWESPALGAWGLGWEVWLDGQEITQFTYFQQAGGQMLNPVSVEITYGLDRIAIALQRVQGFQHIRWNDTYTAGDLNLRGEWEHSKYYFEVADVERLRRMYDLYEQEAEACLAANLVLPAHDYVLKCSHTFNILDTRGAIGVTERQAFFARMRDLSRRIAEAYLEQRQRLEYPWLVEDDSGGQVARKSGGAGDQVERQAQSSSGQDLTAPFLFEIGVEELPAGDLGSALEQLRSRAPAMLDSLHLAHQEIRIQGTPRRLVVWVEGLASQQPELEQVVKGPPAGKAYDSLGEPTKAAEGFARSKGVELRDLETRQMDGGLYVVARVRQAGRPAIDALSDALPALITSLRFDKSMRWNRSNVAFSRPIRWLLALYGDQVIPFEYAGLRSGRATRGLRFQQPEEFDITHASDYLLALASQGIVIDVSERQALVREQVSALASEVEGKANLEPDLLAEVTNLVEAPAGLRGEFDASHLDLPREVLISVMKKHQRYFPVEREGRNAPGSSSSEASQDSHAVYSHSEPHGLQEGEVFGNRESPGWEGTATLAQGGGPLLPYFIAIRNGDHQGLELVTEGNEHVIRARFLDAAFFIKEDLNRPLQAYLPRLSTLTFQARLGSMLDKTRRIVSLTGMLSEQTDLPGPETAVAVRAAELCKADLVTRMVVEMTSLQGIMGRYYALHSGESEAVAAAIFEHYLPRYSGDRLPSQLPGLVVGLADRLDSLCGLFAADLPPTSAKDPFAQRRAALGLVQNLIGHELDFDLRLALEKAAGLLPIPASPESQKACLEFIKERLRNFLLDQKYRYDVVEAVLAVQGDNPARAARAIKELSLWVTRPDWRTILPAFARCVRITRSLSEEYPHNPQALLEPAESDLYRALLQAEAALRKPGSVDDLLQAFVPMIPAVNRFFEQVLVMTDEATVRENRLGLLQRIRSLAEGVVDLSRLEGF